jgi:hypothetical protein
VTSCPCGTPGFRGRKDLAGHLNAAHLGGHAVPRALLLADRIVDGIPLAPEDLVVIAPDRIAVSRPPKPVLSHTRERLGALSRETMTAAGLPDDATLNAAIAAAGLKPAAPLTRKDVEAARAAAPRPHFEVDPPPPVRLDLDGGEATTTTNGHKTEELVRQPKPCGFCAMSKDGRGCKRHRTAPVVALSPPPPAPQTSAPTPPPSTPTRPTASGIAALINQLVDEVETGKAAEVLVERGKAAAVELEKVRALLR